MQNAMLNNMRTLVCFTEPNSQTRMYSFEYMRNGKNQESDQVILILAMSWHEKYDYFVDCSHLVAFSRSLSPFVRTFSLLQSLNRTLLFLFYNYINCIAVLSMANGQVRFKMNGTLRNTVSFLFIVHTHCAR